MYRPTAFPKSDTLQACFAYAVCAFLAFALLGSCSTEEDRTGGKVDENQSEKKENQDQENLRFVSNDRKKEQELGYY